MGLQDRDYMRDGRRAEYRGRRAPTFGSLIWGVLAVIGSFYLVTQGYAWWVGQRVDSVRVAPSPSDPVVSLSKVQNADPFKGDPTWHPGPRPSPEAPSAQAPPAAPTVYKCVTGGAVTYSGSGNCRGGVATPLSIDPGPDAAAIAKAQADTRRAIERTNAQLESIRQQALAEQPQSTVYMDQSRQQIAPKAECPHIDLAIKQLDNLARSPLPGPQQDQIRTDRRRLRDRQVALRC